jgi:CheY-like chemotaxis protein
MGEQIAYALVDIVLFLIVAPWALIVLVPFLMVGMGFGIILGAPLISLKHRYTSTEKLKVLMVDDNPQSLILLEKILVGQSCILKIVDSGLKAIDLLRTEKFDLMVLDYSMPEMNGAETIISADKTLSTKYANEDGQMLPVIEYTSNKEETMSNLKPLYFSFVGKLCKSMPPSALKPIISQILNEQIRCTV